MELSIYYSLRSMRVEKLDLKRRLGKERPRSPNRRAKGNCHHWNNRNGQGAMSTGGGGNMNPSPGIHTFVQFTPFEYWTEQVTCF